MYRSQENVTMWTLAHNTIAGDMAVTTFIQVRTLSAAIYDYFLDRFRL